MDLAWLAGIVLCLVSQFKSHGSNSLQESTCSTVWLGLCALQAGNILMNLGTVSPSRLSD